VKKGGTKLMDTVLASAIPAIVAAIVSLITFFSTRNTKLYDKIDRLEQSFEYEMAKQARTRILRFNNELMCGQNYTKEYFDDMIENSIDVYEAYYENPSHKNLKNGIAKSAIKNIKRIYDLKMQTNSFLQYPKEGDI
jgi:hypothetical protein